MCQPSFEDFKDLGHFMSRNKKGSKITHCMQTACRDFLGKQNLGGQSNCRHTHIRIDLINLSLPASLVYDNYSPTFIPAKKNGVDFLEGVQINNLLRDELGKKVIGVEYINSSHYDNEESLQTHVAKADVVVIAAGANSSNPVLGISNP